VQDCCFAEAGLTHSVFALAGGLETTEEEGEEKNDAHDPEAKAHAEVVTHGPLETASSGSERARADGVPSVAEDDSGDDDDAELEEAGEEGAVDGQNAILVPECTDEHEEGVEGDDAEAELVEAGDQGELRALSQAVNVTVFEEGDSVLQQAFVEALVVHSHHARGDIDVGGVRVGRVAVSTELLVGIPGLAVNGVRVDASAVGFGRVTSLP
jgi:hypothetical protein